MFTDPGCFDFVKVFCVFNKYKHRYIPYLSPRGCSGQMMNNPKLKKLMYVNDSYKARLGDIFYCSIGGYIEEHIELPTVFVNKLFIISIGRNMIIQKTGDVNTFLREVLI